MILSSKRHRASACHWQVWHGLTACETNFGRRAVICGASLLLFAILLPHSTFADSTKEGGLSVLPAGTLADGKDERWNRLVLLATPRVASGDVDMLSASIRDTVSMFSLTILASVNAGPASNAKKKFQLDEVGVGFSARIQGKQTVISTSKAAALGLSLGFVQRQMLGENEKQLRTLIPVVRTSTLLVFDAPAILLRRQQHEEVFIRHFIYVSSSTGRLATIVWVINKDQAGRLSVGTEKLQLLGSGHREDRKIHVDKNEFSLLGIPSKKAFAIEELTPGKALNWTAAAKKYSSLRKFDRESLQIWVNALNEATRQ